MKTNAQINPLWNEKKIKNYLPHMTVPEVDDFLSKSDLVIIPIGALEQHSSHLPIGTDFINGVEQCKLIAQERDILVAPVLMAGQSPYHMAFAGSITLSAETIVQVHMETVESLIKHGFKRFVFMNSHGGNRAITTFLVDQINQKTAGVAVDFGVAINPFLKPDISEAPQVLDRHAGTGETSDSLYLMPDLVQLEKATATKLTLPKHLENMIPGVVDNDPTAKLLFLSEALKAEETGKKTSTIEMTETGVWGELNPKEATVERGKKNIKNVVQASVKFIDKWNESIASS
ncbi:creatininase family protein [Cellulophaga baltica]|uniref:creatininase family protein n=1 Tax=Cellulophaga TaxID=104264 RepID=UPI001C07C5FB|nr:MULTISPECIES: creatininase family protein [Cellulophaga]MBU2995847.1 creatininase family protein [Cellulophaga baltica]MDO6767242.1 creatininase family protein [Cellulophaga sp. 1_MG-2023]